MKKVMCCVAAVLAVGCSSVEYHNGKQSLLMQNVQVEPSPLKADIQVGQAISGVAECEKWFGFTTKKPAKQTYGAELQVSQGNFSTGACTRGAVYEALTKNNADVIIAPRYTSVKKSNGCLFGFCIHVVDQVIVTGYKGNIRNIMPMDEFIIRERQKNGTSAIRSEAKAIPVAKKGMVEQILMLPVTITEDVLSVFGG